MSPEEYPTVHGLGRRGEGTKCSWATKGSARLGSPSQGFLSCRTCQGLDVLIQVVTHAGVVV